MIIEVQRGAGHAMDLQVFRGGVKVCGDCTELALDQVRLVGGPEPDGAFGLQLQQVIFALVIEAQVKVQVRVAAYEAAEARHQPDRAEGHGG